MIANRISAVPLLEMFWRRVMRRPSNAIFTYAESSCELAPAEAAQVPPAYYLEGQFKRVSAAPFSVEDPRRVMMGGYTTTHSATTRYVLRDAYLMDGVLYHRDTSEHMHPKLSSIFDLKIEEELAEAAIYCTPGGNRYFGQWLMDDCLTYLLAEDAGTPITTAQPIWDHTDGYESRLQMQPRRTRSAFIRKLYVFADVGQNQHKRMRRDTMRNRLLATAEIERHPGIFILRGDAGIRRILTNEMEIAERLRTTRGFKVIDPLALDVGEIIAACAGAETVVGVEGSQLLNGLQLLGPGDNMLVLQPPNRFVTVLKDLADRDQQNFGFVVGIPEEDGFSIPVDEVERTLDLFPAYKTG